MNKQGISLEVKLIADGIDEEGNPVVCGLFDAIVQEAASNIESRISSRIDRMLDDQFLRLAKEIIKEKIGAMVDAFMTNPIFPTDQYGSPKGSPTTLAEEIQKQFKTYLTEQVGSKNGEREERYGEGRVPRIVWAARKAASELSEAAVREHLDILRKEFTTHLTDKIAAAAIKG